MIIIKPFFNRRTSIPPSVIIFPQTSLLIKRKHSRWQELQTTRTLRQRRPHPHTSHVTRPLTFTLLKSPTSKGSHPVFRLPHIRRIPNTSTVAYTKQCRGKDGLPKCSDHCDKSGTHSSVISARPHSLHRKAQTIGQQLQICYIGSVALRLPYSAGQTIRNRQTRRHFRRKAATDQRKPER